MVKRLVNIDQIAACQLRGEADRQPVRQSVVLPQEERVHGGEGGLHDGALVSRRQVRGSVRLLGSQPALLAGGQRSPQHARVGPQPAAPPRAQPPRRLAVGPVHPAPVYEGGDAVELLPHGGLGAAGVGPGEAVAAAPRRPVQRVTRYIDIETAPQRWRSPLLWRAVTPPASVQTQSWLVLVKILNMQRCKH